MITCTLTEITCNGSQTFIMRVVGVWRLMKVTDCNNARWKLEITLHTSTWSFFFSPPQSTIWKMGGRPTIVHRVEPILYRHFLEELWRVSFVQVNIVRVTCCLTFSRLMTYMYICRTAPLTSRCFILYIYSTNIHTEYFKHAAHPPFFPLQNAIYFIMLPFLVPVLFTF